MDTAHNQGPEGQGLGAAEAAVRLARDGRNELPQERQRTPIRIVLEALREPMLQLLLVAGVICLFLGDLAEALILLAAAVMSIGLVVVQESRTEKALSALKDLSSPTALVIRDGVRRRLLASDIVAGDVVVLVEGDRVPADGLLIAVANLEVDESLLTGESLPVRKRVGDGEGYDARPGGDDTCYVWSGSLIVRGSGLTRIVATGLLTEIGRIGKSLNMVCKGRNENPQKWHLKIPQMVLLAN